MSGIYIPDKELPESCGKCFIDMITDAFPACKAAKNYEEGKALIIKGFGSGERPANCPLIPAADVRPAEAEWTHLFDPRCSRCGESACAGYDETPWMTRYCPHCGAKMKNPEAYE